MKSVQKIHFTETNEERENFGAHSLHQYWRVKRQIPFVSAVALSPFPALWQEDLIAPAQGV